jgi:hypothetical protein
MLAIAAAAAADAKLKAVGGNSNRDELRTSVRKKLAVTMYLGCDMHVKCCSDKVADKFM